MKAMTTETDKTSKSAGLLNLPLSSVKAEWLTGKIRDVPDFPKPGIMFKDLTPLFADPEAFSFVIDVMTQKCRTLNPTVIAGIEARGFILAPTIAYQLGIGFVPIRKPGKLPYKVHKMTYDLEYGTDTIEMHEDGVSDKDRVVLIDDLLATGGTAGAGEKLLTKVGAKVVGIGFVIELGFLNGKEKLPADAEIFSLLTF
jgi:adenine phosphoribosyltransferase